MNKQRRKELSDIIDRIAAMGEQLNAIKQTRNDIVSDLEALRDEEQESFDSLPEGLQDSERGQDMQAAVDNLDNALQDLDIDLDLDVDGVVSNIDDARGAA